MPDSKPSRRHWLTGYVSALVAVGVGFLLRKALIWMGGGDLPPYITLYPAIMLSALFGGLGPGILATLASALAVDYYVLAPINTFAMASLSDAVGLAFFSGMGVFMSVVAELYRRSRKKAAAHEGGEAPADSLRHRLLLNAGIVASFAILAVVGWQSAQSLRGMTITDRWITHTHAVIQGLDRLLLALTEAETGQRGFLLTGEEKYLEPFQSSLGLVRSNLASLMQLTRDNGTQQQRLAGIETLVQQKTAEFKQTIELRRSRGLPAAMDVVSSDKGKILMDHIRKQVADAQDEESRLLRERTAAKSDELAKTLQALLAGGVLGILLLATVFFFLRQENIRRAKAEAEVRLHRDHLKELVAAGTKELGRSNDALRQQREWLSVTLKSIGDAVLATDIAGHITFLNPVAQALSGWRESEVLGQPAQKVFQITNEQTHALGEDIVARVLKENKVVALANHTALIARDGRVIPIEDSAAPIRDEYGTVSGVVVVFHDVTEKRFAQKALRESEARYRTMFETMIEGFCVVEVVFDAQGKPVDYRFLEVNPTFEKQTGLHNAQGRMMREMAPDHEAHWYQVYGNVAVTGQPAQFVNEARALGRWFEVSAYRVGGAESRKVAILFNDITERQKAREAQARLAAIVETSDDAIMAKDLGGIITSWNGAAQRLFGYSSEEVMGRSIKMLLPGERQDEEDLIMARLLSGERVEHFETVRLAKDGRIMPVSATISPIKDATGRVIGASKIIRDISERKRAEEKLLRQAEALRASNEVLSRFNQAAVGRELRMIELKKEINGLCAKLGEEPCYSLDFEKKSAEE